MAPIRIAFIGLSASGWAKNAHWPYLQQTKKYQITGILNSSKNSSQAAIKQYELPSTVKAYGSSKELAEDSDNFDLAICSVWVNKHHELIHLAAAKGKPCYVEWPLGKTLAEAEDLVATAKKAGGAKTIVGLQARRSPVVLKVKELVESGAIGKVFSVNLRSSAGNMGQVEAAHLGRAFNDKEDGANITSIHFGHTIDYVLYTLGQSVSTLSGIMSTQRKTVQLKHPDGQLEDMKRETPDQIMFQGHLSEGAVITVHQRGGAPFKGTPGLVWRIYGEKGEIEVTSQGAFLNIGYGDDMHIRVHDQATDEVREIDWRVDDGFEGLPQSAQNVARVYEAFADGRHQDYASWEEAVERHRLIEMVEESSRSGRVVKL